MSQFSAGQNTWQIAKHIVADAAELPAVERDAFVTAQCRDNAGLLAEVRSLLAHLEGIDAYIESPAAMPDGGALHDRDGHHAPSSMTGQIIGAYRLGAEVGSGGMGVVYAAERADGAYQQKVAIKLLRSGSGAGTSGNNAQDARRMARERQALAQLDHPNIARLLDGGTTPDAAPYIVMEFVEGEDIDKYCEHEQLDLRERVALMRGVCAAVQSAHQRLLIHRDIKPSNILVTREGAPKLLDFGIARLLEASTEGASRPQDATHATALLFTPRYASPEQIRGQAVTVATDVYGLGLLLYELLAGASPYERIASSKSSNAADAMVAMIQDEPRRASEVARKLIRDGNPAGASAASSTAFPTSIPGITRFEQNPKQLEGELDTILLKACAKLPAERYQTVAQLDDDLSRWLAGKPILARPQTWAYTFFKLINRHRFATSTAILASLAIIAGVVGTVVQKNRAEAERAKAEARYAQVRDLASRMVTDYYDLIAKLPGSTELRNRMTKDAIKQLDDLALELPSDAALAIQMAAAYEKLGQASFADNAASLGNGEVLDNSLKKAALMLAKASSEPSLKTSSTAKPDVPNPALEIAWCDNQQSMAERARTKGDYDKAQQLRENTIARLEVLVQLAPNEEEYFFKLIDNNYSLAAVANLYQQRSAKTYIEAAKLATERWLKLSPQKKWVDYFAIRAARQDFQQARFEHDDAGALISVEKENVLLEARSKSAPDNVKWIRDFVNGLNVKSSFQFQLGKFIDALNTQDRALALIMPLLNADPADTSGQAEVIRVLQNRGMTLFNLDRKDEARAEFEKTYRLCSPMTDTNKTSISILKVCANEAWWTAKMRVLAKHPQEAKESAKRILAIYDKYPTMFVKPAELGWLKNAREVIAGQPWTNAPLPLK